MHVAIEKNKHFKNDNDEKKGKINVFNCCIDIYNSTIGVLPGGGIWGIDSP